MTVIIERLIFADTLILCCEAAVHHSPGLKPWAVLSDHFMVKNWLSAQLRLRPQTGKAPSVKAPGFYPAQ